MNIPELFGDKPIVGSMASGLVDLVIKEPILDRCTLRQL
jgi:hypothetical protein